MLRRPLATGGGGGTLIGAKQSPSGDAPMIGPDGLRPFDDGRAETPKTFLVAHNNERSPTNKIGNRTRGTLRGRARATNYAPNFINTSTHARAHACERACACALKATESIKLSNEMLPLTIHSENVRRLGGSAVVRAWVACVPYVCMSPAS